MICSNIFGKQYLPICFFFDLPILYSRLSARIGKSVRGPYVLFSWSLFVVSLVFIQHLLPWKFMGKALEVVVIGGAILGVGLGLIIRYGGCFDGTKILGIIINSRTGITVGQVVLVCNIFIFSTAGLVFQDISPDPLPYHLYRRDQNHGCGDRRPRRNKIRAHHLEINLMRSPTAIFH